jgi:nitroreductase
MNVLSTDQSAMDFYQTIVTKIESRSFSSKPVSPDVKLKVLEAAHLTGSGMNSQHWRFILIQDKQNLQRLAADSTTGLWVNEANFAVIVLTNPKYAFHMIDAGRAIQNMMLAAWSFGVASGIFTGVDKNAITRDFRLPSDLNCTAIVGFGYPRSKIMGRKDRKPLVEVAYMEKYGQHLDL